MGVGGGQTPGGGTGKGGSQQIKEKTDQSSFRLEKSTRWWSWECGGEVRNGTNLLLIWIEVEVKVGNFFLPEELEGRGSHMGSCWEGRGGS